MWEGRWGRGRDLWGFRDGRVRGASARSEDQLGVGRLWGPNGAYFSGFGIRLGVCLARIWGWRRPREQRPPTLATGQWRAGAELRCGERLDLDHDVSILIWLGATGR